MREGVEGGRTRANPPAMIMAKPETPFIDAAPVAYEMGEPVAVAAVATPVEAMVEAATPALVESTTTATAVEDGQA